MTASQKRINKNEFETLKKDIVKPHAEYSCVLARLKRMLFMEDFDVIAKDIRAQYANPKLHCAFVSLVEC